MIPIPLLLHKSQHQQLIYNKFKADKNSMIKTDL